MDQLADYVSFNPMPGSPMKELFPAALPDMVLLLESLLAIDPNKRKDCTQALQLPYFRCFF